MPSPHNRTITMRDVARAAGVHVTTVSLALRNSPQLPPHTRKRIQMLAREMGYRTNPLVAAFVQQRRIAHPGKFQGVLAFITHSTPEKRSLTDNSYIARMFAASSEYAAESGFRVEPFEARDYGHDRKRLEKTLHARNIRGLLFPPTEAPEGEIVPLDWEHFATVTLSTSIQKPEMDRVQVDHFGGACLAVRKLWERGYERPGFFSLLSTDERNQGRWRGGFLAETQRLKFPRPIPPLVESAAQITSSFRRWYERWQPDVLVSIALTFETCLPVLQEMSISIPKDTALVNLNIHVPDGRQAGIHTSVEACSRIAVDLLVSKLYRNTMGLPTHPQASLHLPVWQEGTTLPPKKNSPRRNPSPRSQPPKNPPRP